MEQEREQERELEQELEQEREQEREHIVMKNSKIQEAVWEQMCNEYYPIRSWASPFQKKIREAVAKTIELMEKQATPFTTGYKEGYETATTDIQKKLSKKSTIGIIRHEPIDVDAYKCGYEAAAADIQKKLSKTNLVSAESYEKGYEAGCTEFARLTKVRASWMFLHKSKDQEVFEKKVDTLLKDMLPRKLDGRVKRMATLKGKVKA